MGKNKAERRGRSPVLARLGSGRVASGGRRRVFSQDLADLVHAVLLFLQDVLQENHQRSVALGQIQGFVIELDGARLEFERVLTEQFLLAVLIFGRASDFEMIVRLGRHHATSRSAHDQFASQQKRLDFVA